MTKNSPSPKHILKSYQILIFALICGVVFITLFFAFLCINENKEIEMRHLARIDYTGEAIKNAVEVANNVMYAYESRYDDRLRTILYDFTERFVQAGGDPDLIDLDALKQEYETMYSFGVALYIFDNTNTIIASTEEAEIGHEFSEVPEFEEELTHIYDNKKVVLDITTRGKQSSEMIKYGYAASDRHDYLLEVGIVVPYFSLPDKTRYGGLDPNIITTPNTVFLFSKSAILYNDPERGLLQLGSDEQALSHIPERLDYLSRMFAEKEHFSIDVPEENKRIDYYFIPYPAEDAPSRSFISYVLEVTTDLTPLHKEIFQNTLFFIIITIVCDGVFICMGLIIIRFVVHPINQIIDDIEIIANGEYDHKIKQTKGPEFDRLEASTTKMISAFQEQNAILLQKNSLLFALLETPDHGVAVVDPDLQVLMFNEIWCKMWNLSEDLIYVGADGVKMAAYCMNQTNNPELYMSNLFKIHDSHDTTWNSQIYLSNGKVMNTFSSPIQGSDGTFYGRVWKVEDVTEEFLKQQKLERAYVEILRKDSQLALALEATGEGLWTWDTSTELFTLNPEFVSRYRSLSQEQSIDSFISAVHPDERELSLNTFREITKMDSGASIEFELQLQSNEGMWRWIMSRGSVSEIDDDGVSMIITGTFVDITERRQYEKHLHEANRKMIMLSQITRHDIMNQLNNLFAVSDALSDEVSDAPSDTLTMKNLLELMENGLTTVTRQMEFSKNYQELGVHGAEWQDVNVHIENVRPLLDSPAGRKVELGADTLPLIFADPLLEKAVYNLIENSLRHGERVTSINVTFSVEEHDNGVLIFEDNGVGVPDKDKEKIFEKEFGKNTGLGLFLIREIFELTEMPIRECGKPGYGARFEIAIPAGYWKWK